MTNLSNKLGDMEFDGLISGLNPAPVTVGGTFAAVAEATTIKRGTLLQKAGGKLAVYTSGNPDCILADDIEAGTSDVAAVVYITGCFNTTKVEAMTGATLTDAAIDTLRTKGIIFKASAESC